MAALGRRSTKRSSRRADQRARRGDEAGHRLRRRRHDAVDVRHGSRRHALQLQPRRAGRRGSRRSGSRPPRAWSGSSMPPQGGLHHRRAHRPQRQPAGGHAGQPGQGRLHRVHRGQLLHEVDRCRLLAAAGVHHLCGAAKCTTIEYKSQTRGTSSPRLADTTSSPTSATSSATSRAATPTTTVKLPNPTYYLP